MTATSIFYIQSVNHLEKKHEVRLAYWNTLPLLAPVKFRTSCDRRREKVQTEERKSQVQWIGSEILLPNHDYYFNDENDVYVYLVLFTPALMFSYGQDNSCKWTSLGALSLCGVTVCVL